MQTDWVFLSHVPFMGVNFCSVPFMGVLLECEQTGKCCPKFQLRGVPFMGVNLCTKHRNFEQTGTCCPIYGGVPFIEVPIMGV